MPETAGLYEVTELSVDKRRNIWYSKQQEGPFKIYFRRRGKMKRLISLALVLMLALGALSVTAYACDLESDDECPITRDEGIMPLAAGCPYCFVECRRVLYPEFTHVTRSLCPRDTTRYHDLSVVGWVFVCPNCNRYCGADQSHATGLRSCTNISQPCFPNNIEYIWNNY